MTNDGSISSDTMVYLDSRLHVATYHAQLMDMQPIYLCNDYLTDYDGRRELENSYGYGYENENNNNNNGEGEGDNQGADGGYNYGGYSSGSSSGCPQTGLYSFENVALQLPSVPNKVYDWAATGWTGSVSIDMYLDSSKYQLIGRCQLNVVTHMDDSYSGNGTSTNNFMSTVMSAIPEAGVTGMIILGTFAACAFLGIVGYVLSRADDGDDMDFKPMKHHVEVA